MSERNRLLLRSLPILVTTHADDGEGTYTGVYTGLQVKSTESPKELVGRSLGEVLNPEATATLVETFAETIDSGSRQYVEYPVQFGDETFWRGSYTVPLETGVPDGPAEVLMAGFDLTRHQEREEALYDVFDALESHTSRRDLERAFCTRLVEGRRYEMAWIGAADRDGEPTVRASAGADEYLAALRDATGSLGAAADPGVRALRSTTPVSVRPIDPDDGDWSAVATAHDLQAASALPLEHDGVEHGVLAVYLSDAEYLVPWREEVLADYANAVGYALSATMWQWALAADAAATLAVTIRRGSPLLGLAAEAGGGPLEVASVVPRSGETAYYIRGEWCELEAAADRCDGVEPYGVSARGEAAVTVATETPEHRLVRLGSRIRSFRLTPDEATLGLAVPDAETARSASRVLQEGYPGATITVQWGHDDVERTAPLTANVGASLTDRQYEMLEAAYRHGYFDRDRKCNLSELAEALDLSRWTVSEHLRLAQRELCSHLLD